MRSTCTILLALLVACGDGDKLKPDASPPDSPSDGIAEARAATECITHCPNLNLRIFRATVTSVRPKSIGTSDPAGFTIQAQQMGPALFVGVDPTMLTPPLHVGNVVSFTITKVARFPERSATSLTDLTVVQTGTDVTPLLQDISNSAILDQDAELVTVTGTVASNVRGPFSGSDFVEVQLDTAGVHGNPMFVVRGPSALMSGVAMKMGCHITIPKAPFFVFNYPGEGIITLYAIDVYDASDFRVTGCPPPLELAVALSATSVKLTFDRDIEPSSVMADGSQFTFDNGLTASAATVSGKTITLTTSAQSPRTNYLLTVANNVTDLQGNSVAASTMVIGFDTPAIVRINEVNANLGCGLLELRVVQGGPMTGFQLTERNDSGVALSSLTFTNFIVQTNDLIVVHASNGATCNSGTSTNETVAVDEQPKAMFAANFDTAYDWYATGSLNVLSNVITLFDAGGTIVDAVFLSDGLSAQGATLTAAGLVGAANQWMPAQATYDAATFLAAAVDNLRLASTGTSIQRIDNNDTNAKADWTTGAGLPATWGALNVGQTAFPLAHRASRR